MWQQLAASVGFLALKWVYHRWIDQPDRRRKPPGQEIQVPRTDDGAPIPLVFGRCRVRAPVLAWASDPYDADVYVLTSSNQPPLWTTAALASAEARPSHRAYALDMLFIAGIPMGSGVARGNSLAGPKLHNVWWGDYKLPTPGQLPYFSSSLFYGQSVSRLDKFGGIGRGGGLRGSYHWFGGWTDQSFTNPASQVGDRLITWGANSFGNGVPGLANMMCVSFTTMPKDSANPYFNTTRPDPGAPSSFEAQPLPANGFIFGESPSVDSVSFEVSSYGDRLDDVTGKHIFTMQNETLDFGGDADPVEVIYALLVDKLGKLGHDPSRIDVVSFAKASQTLKSEGHGYSRVIEDASEADGIIQDVLLQIDGVLDENPTTGKIEIRLIRSDFNPATIPVIDRSNCDKLVSGAAGGRSNLINKVKITYENRDKDYAQDSEIAQSPANALGGDGTINEIVIDMPGVKRAPVALQIALRELAARSRPLIKCRAMASAKFLRVMRGDAVRVVWSNPDIDLVFRVANVDRGTLREGMIALDLIQDTSYVWRGLPTRVWDPSWAALE